MMKDLEPVYDEHIAPLMERIIAICKEHDMPFVACFQYSDGTRPEDEDEGPMVCTSYVLSEGHDEALLNAVRVLQHNWQAVPGSLAMTITGGGND